MSQTEFDVETMDMAGINAVTEPQPKRLNMVRSEASHKAWETRRKNKEAANAKEAVPGKPGLSPDESGWFKTFPVRLAEKREELAAVQAQYEEMLALWDNAIESITAK